MAEALGNSNSSSNSSRKKHDANNCRANDVVAIEAVTTTEPNNNIAICENCNCKMGLYCITVSC